MTPREHLVEIVPYINPSSGFVIACRLIVAPWSPGLLSDHQLSRLVRDCWRGKGCIAVGRREKGEYPLTFVRRPAQEF